jgi:protein-S-isoprenylcysteine O-methyltransferase Ste14
MGSRLTGLIGSLVMLSFGAISFYRFYNTGIIFFLLMTFRDVLASWLLIGRREKVDQFSNKTVALISYLSSAIPLFYFKGIVNSHVLILISSLLSILGFSISTLALIELGQSFGVSPANRGRITTGVYKITNHPMYFGYVISEFGFLIINPSNFLIFLISSSLYFYRATIENKRLNI